MVTPAPEDEFVALLRERWRRGAVEYGNRSFGQPFPQTADEILQELVDVAGWAFVAWAGLRERLARVQAAAERLAPDESVPPGSGGTSPGHSA